MKKLLIILSLVLVPLFGIGQNYAPTLTSLGKTLVFNNVDLIANTLEIGLLLKLRASSISEDSLTYNSSANLVTYSNLDTVIMDGSSEVVIGNSVRFGTPTSGTIYQIADTGISDSILILDQTFTGSVTDEFYWGGVGKWYDESGAENHATQTTAINQPKLIWANTDSSDVHFDGINDYMILPTEITDLLNINNIHSIFISTYINEFSGDIRIILGTSLNATNRYSVGVDDQAVGSHIYNGVSIQKGLLTTELKQYNITSIVDNFTLKFYVDAVEYNSSISTPLGFQYVTRIGAATFGPIIDLFDGNINKIYIYNRVLSENEMKKLSE